MANDQSDEGISPGGYAIASFHLTVGVIGLLMAKGLISRADAEGLFDAALIGAEAGPMGPVGTDGRRLLELVARLLLADGASPRSEH